MNQIFFTAFDSDKHTIIGDKNIGITKISATKLYLLTPLILALKAPKVL